MYNFSMPSSLKAWLDYVHVIGVNSPAGEGITPLRGKPVAVVSARHLPIPTQRCTAVLNEPPSCG